MGWGIFLAVEWTEWQWASSRSSIGSDFCFSLPNSAKIEGGRSSTGELFSDIQLCFPFLGYRCCCLLTKTLLCSCGVLELISSTSIFCWERPFCPKKHRNELQKGALLVVGKGKVWTLANVNDSQRLPGKVSWLSPHYLLVIDPGNLQRLWCSEQ